MNITEPDYKYYKKSCREVLESLGSSENGLSSKEAEERLKKYGQNIIKEEKKPSAIIIFLNQFNSFLIWVLIAATIISFIVGETLDAIVILAILIVNAVLGFIQEYKAEKAIDALKRLSAPRALVLRDGIIKDIPSSEIVPGDILILEEGKHIPADGRVIEDVELFTQESSLTGESFPIKKTVKEISRELLIADQTNMVFAGTIVTHGRGRAVVTATGMATEIGKIAKIMTETKHEPTPMQVQLSSIGKKIGFLTLIICGLIFSASMIRQTGTTIELFLTAVALAVAAIPEGLPAVVTVCLAMGVKKMIKKNALVRKLPAVETLGATTVICSDKTGTLTKNEMTVKKIFAGKNDYDVSGEGYNTNGMITKNGRNIDIKKEKDLNILLRIGALCNNAEINENITGDPTEIALLVSARKAGIKEDIAKENPRIREIPFTSERKIMSTINKINNNNVLCVKGAVEVVLSKCTKIIINGKERKLDAAMKKKIHEQTKSYASQALRVLGFAYKKVKDAKSAEEKQLVFVGLQAMMDPPREEAKEAIKKCDNAGIKVIMITGDHKDTAIAVADYLGIKGKVMTGEDLMKCKNLDDIVESIGVFARVNPEHKIKIVEALQRKGHVVAMTGDGVNDAPALKKADIGIAMGITGTDVAKEASQMILLDDNFATIVNAVEEGRGIYNNIKKFLAFLLSGNIGEVGIVFFSILLGFPLPLVAILILMINLVTDGLPATALSVDPHEPGAMQMAPRKKSEPFYKDIMPYITGYPALMIITALAVFWWIAVRGGNLPKGQTAVFVVVAAFELYQAMSCRSIYKPSFSVGIFKNKWLNMAVLTSVIIVIAIIFVPQLRPIFKTYSLTLPEFIGLVLLSSIGSIYLEITKLLKSRNKELQKNA